MTIGFRRNSRRRRASSRPETDPPFCPEPLRILVTVGTELPFDRLVRTIDDWAGDTGQTDRIFAQIGHTRYRPSNIAWAEFVAAPTFERLFREADLVVSHAGMGTVLSAMRNHTPLLVMPRQAALGEHRNDHQLASARRLAELGLVEVAFDDAELVSRLSSDTAVAAMNEVGPNAEDSLITALRAAIEDLSSEV